MALQKAVQNERASSFPAANRPVQLAEQTAVAGHQFVIPESAKGVHQSQRDPTNLVAQQQPGRRASLSHCQLPDAVRAEALAALAEVQGPASPIQRASAGKDPNVARGLAIGASVRVHALEGELHNFVTASDRAADTLPGSAQFHYPQTRKVRFRAQVALSKTHLG